MPAGPTSTYKKTVIPHNQADAADHAATGAARASAAGDVAEMERASGAGKTMLGKAEKQVDDLAAKVSKAKHSRQEQKDRQRKQHRLQTELRRIEKKIQKLEQRRAELEKQLEQAYTAGEGGDDAQLLSLDFKDISEKLEESYSHWEKTTAALDAN